MRKIKILSIILSLAVVISCMPFFTLQADAFSTGSKILLKSRTVTIKPGKTYKSPKFKLSKKMAVQIPLKITPAGKIKDSDYEYRLKLNMSIKTAKGKTKASYKLPSTGIYNVYTDEIKYENWVYLYNKPMSNPGFAKGSYYITIKNPTKRSIKVNYSVKGYTKFATTASLKKELTADFDQVYVNAGRVGPGIPLIKSVTSSSDDIEVNWTITHDGRLILYPDSIITKDCESVITDTLKNKNKKYKIKLKVYGEPVEENPEEPEEPVTT